jgi:hypothetical protein
VPLAVVYDFASIAEAIAHLKRGGKIRLQITR